MSTEYQASDPGTDRLVIAFAVGALTGAAIALLMAPAAGRDTRDNIGRTARTAREGASRAFEQGRSKLRSGTGRVTAFVGRRRQEETEGGATVPKTATGATLGPDFEHGM